MNAAVVVNRLLETEPLSQIDMALQARDRYLDAQRRGETRYVDIHGQWQPVTRLPRKPKPAAGVNAVTMSRNRNVRRKAFGYPDFRYSVKDRGWPPRSDVYA